MFNAQLRFAARLAKGKTTLDKQAPLTKPREMELPLSTEMLGWLQDTMSGEDTKDGYPDEEVTSVLAQPLDSMLVYCPLGAIAQSHYAAIKPVSNNQLADSQENSALGFSSSAFSFANNNNNDSSIFLSEAGGGVEELSLAESTGLATSLVNNSHSQHQHQHPGRTRRPSLLSTWATQKPKEPAPQQLAVSEAISRLEIMWLQRRAGFEREEGNLNGAMNTLTEALEKHLGTSDYSKADLATHVHTNPEKLLAFMSDNYFVYDKSAHREAGRIQRCFLRHFKFRNKMATRLQKFFRGARIRLLRFAKEEMQKQCVQIIQRRFRIHLKKMARLATKIKMWYKMLKQQEAFKYKLFYFRMARRLQRLARGISGRQVAYQKRLELNMTSLVQRQTRSWNSRRQRTLAITLYHRVFFKAARTIQCMIRRVQAVRRSQLQLLLELAREEDRMKRETEVVDEIIKVERSKTRLYIKTDAGRVHFAHTLNHIRLKDRKFQRMRSSLSEEEIKAHDAMVSFELFDSDGSGLIDEDEMAGMLQQLSIPMSKEEVSNLMNEIDAEGGGEIGFDEFVEWYCGGGGDDAAENANMADILFKQVLRARALIMELTGQVLAMRAERDMMRQSTVWLTKDIACTFRNAHPPKFQCCQCIEPFVLFTDYYAHFDENGCCPVINKPALFFTKFWLQKDWSNQRQIEHEIMRYNDEGPNINYKSLLASFADLSLQRDAGVSELIQKHANAAQIMYLEKSGYPKEAENSKIEMGKEILDAVNLCRDNHLSPICALSVGERLGRSLPEEWITEEKWDMEEFSKWLTDVVDKDIAVQRVGVACFETNVRKLKRNTRYLGDIYVRTLRLLQVSAEASLISIMDARTRRPRKITLTDYELRGIGLDHLTSESYYASKDAIVERLGIINEALQKLLLIHVPGCCESKKAAAKRHVQVGPDGTLTKKQLELLLISDAHTRAYASYKSRLRSSVGKTQIRRLANELWAARYLRLAEAKDASEKKKADLLYFYDRFASEATDDGIDMWDLDLLQDALSLQVKDDSLADVKKQLDPTKSGFIQFDDFFSWLAQEMHKPHFHWKTALSNGFNYFVMSFMNSLYYLHAEQKLLSDVRKISRLELNFRTKSIDALMLAAKLPAPVERVLKAMPVAPTKTTGELALEKLVGSTNSSTAASSVDLISATHTVSAPIAAVAAVAETIENKPVEYEPLTPLQEFAEANRVKQLAAIKKLEDEAEAIKEKLNVIRDVDEKGESLLLFRLAEDEAEAACYRNFFTRRGLYNLRTEKQIMNAADTLIEAFGFCISPGSQYPWTAINYKKKADSEENSSLLANQQERTTFRGGEDAASAEGGGGGGEEGEDAESRSSASEEKDYEVGWALALSVLIYAFDTDCSGSFDEGETKLLLNCAYVGLSERRVLYYFPEVRLDSAYLDKLVDYLAPKVGWRRGWLHRMGSKGRLYISKKSSWESSVMMLVSLSRQIAREKAVQATQLTKTGVLEEEDNDKNDDALMMRTQIFAMRQVHMFLQTTFGKLKIKATTRLVRTWWKNEVAASDYSRHGLFAYTFQLHCEWKGLLITELPHLIRYLCMYFGFVTTVRVAEAATLLSKVKEKDDLYWLSKEDVLALIDPMFEQMKGNHMLLKAKLYCTTFAGRDAVLNMNARARQQSILIALNFEGILVGESNYRCSALGLSQVVKEYVRTASWGIFRSKPKIKMNWKQPPREATTLLLLSRGYFLEDLTLGDIPLYSEVMHKEGGLAADRVSVRDCINTANNVTSEQHTKLQKATRWAKFFFGLPRYVEYCRVAKVISLQGKDVNKAGGDFLRELLTGQSHCVSGEDEDDD